MKRKITNPVADALKPRAKAYECMDTIIPGFGIRVLPSGVKSYFFRYRFRGKRNRIKLGRATATNIADAREKARRHFSAVDNGEDPAGERRRQKGQISSLGQFLDDEYQDYMTKESGHRTGDVQVARIRSSFRDYLDRELAAFDGTLVKDWRRKRRRKAKPTTCNKDLAALRSALSWAVRNGVIDTNPLAKVRPLKEESGKVERYLSDVEETRLMKALEEREEGLRAGRDSSNAWRRERGYAEKPDLRAVPFADHLLPMVVVSLYTGVRRGELFALTRKDLDLESGVLTVRSAAAKTGKSRHVDLCKKVLTTLKEWCKQGKGPGLVFPNENGVQFDNVNKAWKGVLAAAKIEGFRWHDLRHSYASRLVQGGLNLYILKELLGHASIKTTERYAHLDRSATARSVAILDAGPSNVVAFPREREGTEERG